MKKKKLNDYLAQLREVNAKINAMADSLEKEKRDMTKEEELEYRQLLNSKKIIDMRINALGSEVAREMENSLAEAEKLIRENIKNKQNTELVLCRDAIMVSNVQAGGLVPVSIQDIIEPMHEGLILDKVGLPLMTNLVSEYFWPTYEIAEAQIAGEGVALTDTQFDLSKLTATPQRVGIAIPVTRESILASNNIIEALIKKAMPEAYAMLINRVMFGVEKAPGANSLVGPFVALKSSAKAWQTDEPTFKDFVLLKTDVLKSGADGNHMGFVMTAAQKGIAESTPKDAGSGVMVCQDDKIAGIPVFTTHYIKEGYVGVGDWRYQPVGFFGTMSFIIDPFTKARENKIDFVMNADLGTTTLMKDAFKLAKTKSAAL